MPCSEEILEALAYAALALWQDARTPIYAFLFLLKVAAMLLGG
jgi:hypothetical protein